MKFRAIAFSGRNPRFQSSNLLTSEKLGNMGNSSTVYSVLDEVELSKPKASDRQVGEEGSGVLGTGSFQPKERIMAAFEATAELKP